MADSKITALAALTAADPANDMVPIVDVSDTSMAASGTTKRISINNILACSPSATLASLNVTGSSIPANGLYLPTTNTLEFSANSLAQYRIAPLGVFSWYDGAGGTRMTLNSTGLGVGVTPSASGGCLQLKSGITFPATQVASSDVNTLDDYEEGNWTPTITAGSGTPTTTSINTAKYTKIGRLVTLEVDISITAIGTASGVLNFTVPTGFNQSTDGNVGALREVGATASMGQIFYTAPTTVGMAIYNNATVWVNGYRVRGTYTYTV